MGALPKQRISRHRQGNRRGRREEVARDGVVTGLQIDDYLAGLAGASRDTAGDVGLEEPGELDERVFTTGRRGSHVHPGLGRGHVTHGVRRGHLALALRRWAARHLR